MLCSRLFFNLHKRYKVYLLSNTTEISHLHNSKTGIYDYFDQVFMSYQMGIKKPDQRMFQKVISSIGFKPSEYIFIDDDKVNLKAAKQIGITAIHFDVLKDAPLKLETELKKADIQVSQLNLA